MRRQKRAAPGTKGQGEYYRIIVRPKGQFISFRYHDVGDKGHILRLAGRRSSGSWADQAWLISKEDAHLERQKLVPDTKDARKILQVIGPIKHAKGNVFQGHPRKNIPEDEKLTLRPRRAQKQNITKAQEARWN